MTSTTNIACVYCNARVPQEAYNAHIRERHATPTVADLSQAKQHFDLAYATFHARPRPPGATSPSSSAPRGTSYSGETTTFSAWRARHRAAPTRWITSDDVAAFRVDRADASRTPPRTLQKALQDEARELVVRACGEGDVAQCEELVRGMHAFGCLSVHVWTRLRSCEPSLSEAFLSTTRAWMDRSEEWCLIHHRAVKADLCSFLAQSPDEGASPLLDGARLHRLDVHGLAALLAVYCTDQSHMTSFYAVRDDQAQAILDLLQELIDLESDLLDGWYKRRFLDAVVRLSRKSRLYPRTLNVVGVDHVFRTGDRGGFGAIFRGRLSGRDVALKELQAGGRTADGYLKEFCQEAVVWRNIHHPNCLPFYGVTTFTNDGVTRTCMVSPWMTNGNLSVYLSQNPDAPRLPLLFDIASGLEYLHTMEPTVVHGDLKSLNVFVTASGRACLADFGLATVHDAQASVTTTVDGVYGTAGYMAPELISVWEDPNGATLLARLDRRRCDVFALGCIAYEVYAGGPPFQGTTPTVRSQMMLSGSRPRRPTDARARALGLDDDVWELIGRLWAQRPEARLVAASARDFLSFKLADGGGARGEDPEWDAGFLSSLVVTNDLFAL